MASTTTKNKVLITKDEYVRLKKLDKRFGDFLAYFENLIDISEARREVKQKKIISQEKLFKKIN